MSNLVPQQAIDDRLKVRQDCAGIWFVELEADDDVARVRDVVLAQLAHGVVEGES
jgi:hypothetical protein